MSDLIEQVAWSQFSIVQQGEMSWLVKWRGEIEDEFACLKDAEEWITLAIANVSAALRELSEQLNLTPAQATREQLVAALWWALGYVELDHSRTTSCGIGQCDCPVAVKFRKTERLLGGK